MNTENNNSFEPFSFAGLALDPIHVGTGGSRLGRVDNTIVRDPVTRIPKIPGSSLAGVMRAYVAMKEEKYPTCAGQGGSSSSHCGQKDCKVCTVFGFAKGDSGGFAGLASFSDMHVLLFPVPTQLGPHWITCPMALRQAGIKYDGTIEEEAVHLAQNGQNNSSQHINLGWLYLPVKQLNGNNGCINKIKNRIGYLEEYITDRLGIVSDKLFAHIVNSNLEVRTSVAIDPATGTAEDKALFTYEALPRGTVLCWEVTCRNPKHFKIDVKDDVKDIKGVKNVPVSAHSYLEHLGIGGMGSRGMGRLRVFECSKETANSGNEGGNS
jgi:CRISPR-associated protein Cmr4